MQTQVFCFLFLLFLSAQATHYAIDQDLQIKEVPSSIADFVLNDPSIRAYVEFRDDRNVSGWVHYYYKTDSANPDWLQMYLAGYMEGYCAYSLIWDNWLDSQVYFPNLNGESVGFLLTQLDWINTMIESNQNDNFWQVVNLTMAQIRGMYDGYLIGIESAHKSKEFNLTFEQFYLITYTTDLGDVMSKFDGVPNKDLRCSFLCKMTSDSLYVSHTTWSQYAALIRAYKVYDLSLQNPVINTKRISFSSTPGSIASQDDFYILDDARVVTETTLASNNEEVYSFLHPDSLPYWIRITVANLIYKTPEDWINAYFNFRSGTYNNQWFLLDFNNYNATKNNPSEAKDVIWMVEEFYSLTSQQDVTQQLLIPQGYVASYNTPYSPAIQNLSQYDSNYTTDPRAILFKKYAPGIQTREQFQEVMRMNNHSDTGDYCSAIAARCDLNSTTDFPFGAIDCKMTSDSLAGNHEAWIISGPTHQDLPPFSWEAWPQFQSSRAGMPDVFDFDWIFMDPTANYSATAHEHGELSKGGAYAFVMESKWRRQEGESVRMRPRGSNGLFEEYIVS